MKILFVVYGSIQTLSGGFLYDRLLIRCLEEAGHLVRVLSQKPGLPYLLQVLENFDQTFFRAACDFAPDLIVEDELNHPALFMANSKLRSALGVPIVGMVHHLRQAERNNIIIGWAARIMEARFLRTLDGFICNSDFTRRSINIALGNKPEAPLRKPYVLALPGKDRLRPSGVQAPTAAGAASRPGVNPATGVAPNRVEGSTLRILFLGNVIRRKGLHVLISALARLDPALGGSIPWFLTIAGNEKADQDYTRSLKTTIRKQSMDGRIRWAGPVNDEALGELFRSHDVLAVPSQCEGYGIVYAEAMLHGLPVIAGSYGGSAEMVTHGLNGYLLPWEDSAGLAGMLADLGSTPGLLETMQKEALRRGAELPDWQSSMKKAVAFIEGMSVGTG